LNYSWSRFGRDAEFIIASYLKSKGWCLQISKASRGPADIIAISKKNEKWLIQVKSSTKMPRLKGFEVKRLNEMAQTVGGLPVIATFQPKITVSQCTQVDCRCGGIKNVDNKNYNYNNNNSNNDNSDQLTGNYCILFYCLYSWTRLYP
jgi:Holliday junction resolvase